MKTLPILSAPAAAVLLLVVGLGGAMWYLEPEHAWKWAAAMFVLPVLLGGLMLVKRMAGHGWRRGDRATVSRAVVTGGVLVAASLGLSIVERLGVVDGNFSERVIGVMLGMILVITGNSIPKTLEPMSDQSCEPAKKQRLQRFVGWTFVLAGLAYALIWLLVPVDSAGTVATVVLGAAVLLVLQRLLSALWAKRRARSASHS